MACDLMSVSEPARPVETVGRTQSGAQRDGRLPFIHGLRGIAALSVALMHCYDSTPVGDRVTATIPSVIDHVIRRGFLGVDLFFVISGFVISLTLYKRLATFGEFGRFFLRRQLRLDPPYWTAIALSIGSALVVNRLRPLTAAPVPSVGDVIAHLFYLQGFLGIKEIVGIFWTLCQEIQFYLFFGVVILLFDKASASGRTIGWVMLPLYILSVACFWDLVPSPRGLFLQRWFEFFTGVVLFLFWRQQLSRTQLLVYQGVLALMILVSPPTDNGMAWLTVATVLSLSLVFAIAARTGGIKTWLDTPVLRYLGTISYSLYLMHAVVGIRLLKIVVGPGDSPVKAWALYAAALLLSVAASDIVYRVIERPSMNLSHRLKWRGAT
jgi:peptidoglycan/LPS O-acetylase OafA/YrhL